MSDIYQHICIHFVFFFLLNLTILNSLILSKIVMKNEILVQNHRCTQVLDKFNGVYLKGEKIRETGFGENVIYLLLPLGYHEVGELMK